MPMGISVKAWIRFRSDGRSSVPGAAGSGCLTASVVVVPRTYYWAGNEPDIHTAYLFVDAGRPDLAGRWSRWAMEATYGNGPDGLPGNDDCGTMSAWYLFTALGFYPVPAHDKYYVGAPLFPTAEITLPNGRFRINAPGAGPGKYITQSPNLNGTALADFTFRHTDLAQGETLNVQMTSE